MTLTITDLDLEVLGLTKADIFLELALGLYAAERITFGQASRLAGLDQVSLRQIAGRRGIEVQYGIEEFEQDCENLRALGLL
jgi:predicted HTH domain antitoxin